jgi:hypothetical protein
MKIEMSYLLLAFATVLAPTARGQSAPAQPKITGVLTILSPKPGVTPEQIMKIVPAETRATVPLYLDGKIQQWFTRGDGRGVIFILNCKDCGGGSHPHRKPTSLEGKPDGRAVHSGQATLAARDSIERQLDQ